MSMNLSEVIPQVSLNTAARRVGRELLKLWYVVVLARVFGVFTIAAMSTWVAGGSFIATLLEFTVEAAVDFAHFDFVTFWFGNGQFVFSAAEVAIVAGFHLVAAAFVYVGDRQLRKFEREAEVSG